MMGQIARLFNVRPDEFRRLSIISIMLVFFIVGYVWANITIIADFLNKLPLDSDSSIAYLLIGDAIIIIITFAIYSAFADRFANNHIMAGLASVGIIGIALGAYLLSIDLGSEILAPLFLYLVFRGVGEAISTHWGPLVNDYFDTRAAKRIFTLLAAVTRISYLFSSLTVILLNDFGFRFTGLNLSINFGLIELGMLIWLATLLAMLIMSLGMPRLMRVLPTNKISTQSKGSPTSYWQNLYEGYQFAFRSKYLRAFVVVSIFMMVLQALMQFEILRYLNDYTNNATSDLVKDTFISGFFSNILIWGSLLLLPFQLFAFTRLVAWAGVERVNLIFPVTSLLASLALIVIPLRYADNLTATFSIAQINIVIIIAILVIAEFNRTVLNIGIRAVNDEFLYNAVPVRVKGRIRGFISGIVEPFGTFIVGAFLLIPAIVNTPIIIPGLLVVVSIGYLFASMWVSQQYGRALISMIEEENFSFMLEANNRIAFDADTLQSLENRFKQAPDDDTRLLMGRLLIEARGTAYVDLLINAADAGSKYLRAGIIDTFISSDLRSPKVIDMCVKYIVDSDATVRKSAITGLKQLVGVQSDRYLLAALELLNDNDPSLVAEVLPDLINTSDFYFLQHATLTLNELLEHEDPQQRAISVNILGSTDSPRVLLLLLRYLIDRSQVVRLQSVLAIEKLSSKVQITDELVQALSMTVSSLLRDPLDRIRLSAVQIIANLHPNDFAERIMPALLDDNLEVREVAARLLIKHPNETTKTFEKFMESNHSLMTRMTSTVLVRINKKHEPRIYEHIDHLLSMMYENVNRMLALEPLKHYPVIDVVQSIITEDNERALEEIFYMLGSVHGMQDVEVAVEALRSHVPRTRANGVEAIDVMLNLHLLTAIETITNPDMSLNDLSTYGNKTYPLETFDTAQVLHGLLNQHNEDWIIYIGIEALGELGKKLYQAQNQPKQSPLDLLSNMTSGNNQAKTTDIPFTIHEIEAMLNSLKGELPLTLRTALRKARNSMQGIEFERSDQSIGSVISDVERIIFLKRVQFFHDITINQLRKVANICYEVWYDVDQVIFNEGDMGGSLYVIVEGRVGIEQTQADGKSARLDTLRTEASFGEDTLFDESRHSTSAIALSKVLVMRLDNDALIGLIQSYPDMSMNIIRVLSQQIRNIDTRITSMSKQDSQASSLFDKLGI
ncbi:MAG: cyclic nucleotide-binding domain-containing protein [Phototrophicaceae bacterium]